MSRVDSVFKLLKSLNSFYHIKGSFSLRRSSKFGAEKTLVTWLSRFYDDISRSRSKYKTRTGTIKSDLGPVLISENTSFWDNTVQSGALLTDKKEYCTTSNRTTKMSQCEYVVGHDKINNFFYIELQEKKSQAEATQAKLEYAWVRNNLVDMYHTEVPEAFQGRGIAKILAKTAFDYFCEEEVMMRPTCTYLQKFLLENPTSRYMDHVEKCYL